MANAAMEYITTPAPKIKSRANPHISPNNSITAITDAHSKATTKTHNKVLKKYLADILIEFLMVPIKVFSYLAIKGNAYIKAKTIITVPTINAIKNITFSVAFHS